MPAKVTESPARTISESFSSSTTRVTTTDAAFRYESDASPCRPDLYESGNDYKTVAAQFNQLIGMSPNDEVNLETLTAFRSVRFDTQIGKYYRCSTSSHINGTIADNMFCYNSQQPILFQRTIHRCARAARSVRLVNTISRHSLSLYNSYTFIYRFMANHSAEAPLGHLDYSTLASWFGMTGSPGSYVANQGQEKIPDNWVSHP